ncbi:MAG: hypothetical protein JWR83_255, partial [Aeromicrobium sp.]|nr:hypothetical protein [Aeromicrobium sp.]
MTATIETPANAGAATATFESL